MAASPPQLWGETLPLQHHPWSSLWGQPHPEVLGRGILTHPNQKDSLTLWNWGGTSAAPRGCGGSSNSDDLWILLTFSWRIQHVLYFTVPSYRIQEVPQLSFMTSCFLCPLSSHWQCICWYNLIFSLLSDGLGLFWTCFLIFCSMDRRRIFQIFKFWFFFA